MKWTESLNEEQKTSVLHNYGPLLILAGAGSGKTTVLVRRTGRMIDEGIAKPENIVVLTFTNKAARELKERVADKVGKTAKQIWAGTFHSFGLGILRKYHKEAKLPKNFGVIDSTDSRGIVRDLLKDRVHDEKSSFDTEKILTLINEWRSAGKISAQLGDPYHEMATLLLPHYIKRLELLGVVDFEGLLIRPLELFDEYDYILEDYQRSIHQLMVDEFQDTNKLQLKLVKKLVEKHNNLSVVGDDDQAIYGWRGACVENILNFPHMFEECKVVRLEKNYRSTANIINLANHVIKNNTQRHDKVLKPGIEKDFKGELPELFIHENEEVECEDVVEQIRHFKNKGYKYSDIAILYRSNGQGGHIEGVLRHHQIPYSLTGGSTFFERKEVKDVMAYIRCVASPHEISLRRIFSTPPRGIGEKAIKTIESYAKAYDLSFMKAAKQWKELGLSERQENSFEKLYSEISQLRNYLSDGHSERSVSEIFLNFFSSIGYKEQVYQSFKDHATAHKRWMLVEIVGRILQGYFDKNGQSLSSIKSFLDAMDLKDILEDSQNNQHEDRVQMLTLHACKGLEFPVVLMVGLEEDILPHRTLGTDVSEERRLFYVGVTRAKEHLILSRSLNRKKFGKKRPSAPSRFLLEVEEDGLFKTYEEGCRPLNKVERKSLLDDLYKKLNQQIEDNKR